MPESPIRKLVPFAENAKRKGKKVYHLNIGQPDIQTPSVALEAIKNFDNNVVEYSHSAGFESYRKGLASYYQSLDIDVSYNDLMVTTGGSEALLFALNSCLDAGDEIIIPEPFYANYNGFSISAGITVKPISTSISNGFALPPIEDFVKLISPKSGLLSGVIDLVDIQEPNFFNSISLKYLLVLSLNICESLLLNLSSVTSSWYVLPIIKVFASNLLRYISPKYGKLKILKGLI